MSGCGNDDDDFLPQIDPCSDPFLKMYVNALSTNQEHPPRVLTIREDRYSVYPGEGGTLSAEQWSELRAHATPAVVNSLAVFDVGYEKCTMLRNDDYSYRIAVSDCETGMFPKSVCVFPDQVTGEAKKFLDYLADLLGELTRD